MIMDTFMTHIVYFLTIFTMFFGGTPQKDNKSKLIFDPTKQIAGFTSLFYVENKQFIANDSFYSIRAEDNLHSDSDKGQRYLYKVLSNKVVYENYVNDKNQVFNSSELEFLFSKTNINQNWKLRKTFVATRGDSCFYLIWNSNRLSSQYPGINIDDIALSDTVTTSLTKKELLSLFPSFRGIVCTENFLFFDYYGYSFADSFVHRDKCPLFLIKDKTDSIRHQKMIDSCDKYWEDKAF